MGTALLLAMLGAWLSGIGVALVALTKMPSELWMAVVAVHATAMISLVLVTQYAPMIVDATDIAVVAPRPVPDRTVFAARIAHVTVYSTALALCCMFWPLALGWLGYPTPWLLVAVPLVVALSAATSIGLVALLFAVTLRISGAAGFQRAAFLAQIAGAVLLMGGMQVVMPLIARPAVVEWIRGQSWTRALLPPLQQGALFALMRGDTSHYVVGLSCAAVLTPIVLVWFAFRLASRHFVAGLAGDIVRSTNANVRWPGGIGVRVAAWITHSRLERAGFDFVRAMSRRDKVFLRAGVPMVVSFAVMSFASVVPAARANAMPRFVLALPIYLMLVGLPGLLETVRFTEHSGASWVLRAAPVASWREFVVGGTKALFATYILPLLFVMVCVSVAFGGVAGIAHALGAALVTAGIALVAARAMQHGIPFWREPKMGEMDFTNLAVLIGSVAGAVMLAGAHALLQIFVGPWAFAGWAVLGLALCLYGWGALHRTREPLWR